MGTQLLPLNETTPNHWSVRDGLATYLFENGFDTRQYDDDFVTVNFWGIRFTLPNPPNRKLAIRYHDLHHVMTGYGTDPIGEAEISAWELRRGIGVFGWYVRSIIMSGVLLGLLHSPKRTWCAWKAGWSECTLPKPSMEHYETLLDLTVGELRALYGVSPTGIAKTRQLHRDAPQNEVVHEPLQNTDAD